MSDRALMFLSCPNTPGNGYNTQYRAHVYEWGYEELKNALADIGFEIVQEVGLVMGAGIWTHSTRRSRGRSASFTRP